MKRSKVAYTPDIGRGIEFFSAPFAHQCYVADRRLLGFGGIDDRRISEDDVNYPSARSKRTGRPLT
ncbi:hypothetical protein [Leptolyngbya sp. 7M]|uniref:hypothetical protein n=1 Tax=Leptolyngbya sp. 7M TaxID=2812896 RepID=UPI001B8AA3B3|nr:hypothetical protein [Leptolyngbya sp. 7M]QYO63367.1 hypothetical protein JVX88_26150 [Leptolyngbya sp. 7M]